jgi:Xaa-Pro dipeptidase
VRDIRLFGAWSTKKTMGPNWLEALGEILREKNLQSASIGIEGDWLPVNRLEQFRRAFPQAKFEDVSELLEDARRIKEPYEIECARVAAGIADHGMATAIDALARGGSEREVAVETMAAMNRRWLTDHPDIEVCDFGSLEGGVHNGLWCWVMSGERVLINTDNPTLRVPQRGEIAVVFIWTNCNGVHSENERSVAIGSLPAERRAAYDAVLAVRAEAQKMLRPGVAAAEVFAAAKAEYQRQGFGKYLPGRIGHGIGLGAHEHLSLDPNSKTVLEPGMIMSFEPNLRIPEWGGMQHSDTVLITPEGFEFLTKTERGYIEVAR